MLSNSPQLLLLRLRLAFLSVVHAAADVEERLSWGARRLRWAARDRIDEALAIVPAASPLLRGSIWMLSIFVQALTVLLSLLPSPAELHRRWRAAVAARKSRSVLSSTTSTTSTSTAPSTKKQQPRGRPPPRPATEAAVILAEADEAELPLERVADVLEWCELLRDSEREERDTERG